MHQAQPKYDFAGDGTSPGEKYNALAQCQLSFGNDFKPHLKNEVPFEVTKKNKVQKWSVNK
jgi:hypothetical protein